MSPRPRHTLLPCPQLPELRLVPRPAVLCRHVQLPIQHRDGHVLPPASDATQGTRYIPVCRRGGTVFVCLVLLITGTRCTPDVAEYATCTRSRPPNETCTRHFITATPAGLTMRCCIQELTPNHPITVVVASQRMFLVALSLPLGPPQTHVQRAVPLTPPPRFPRVFRVPLLQVLPSPLFPNPAPVSHHPHLRKPLNPLLSNSPGRTTATRCSSSSREARWLCRQLLPPAPPSLEACSESISVGSPPGRG